MEMTGTVPASSLPGAAWLKGRVIGAVICGFFGAVWMIEALYFVGIATHAWVAAIWISTLAFIAWPVIRLRSFPRQPYSPGERQHWAAISKPYRIVVTIEWVLCAVAVNWLVHIQRYELIPLYIGVIVGIHFLPLAKIFMNPIYYVTGTVMTLGALAAQLIPAAHVRGIASFVVPGITLWATETVILCRDWVLSRRKAYQLGAVS